MRDRFCTNDTSTGTVCSPSAAGTAVLRPGAGAVSVFSHCCILVLLSFIFILLFSSPGRAATPSNTTISNVSRATYTTDAGTPVSTMSNTAAVTTMVLRTRSAMEFLQYAPIVGSAQSVTVQPTSFSPTGSTGGPFVVLPAPVSLGSATLDLSSPLPLVPATLYHQGEPVFIRLTDPDQNNDPTKTETVVVTITDSITGDREVLLLTETGPNTGVFVGYIQTTTQAPVGNNGMLSVAANSLLNASYTDSADPADTSATSALVDPYGLVFSSATGQPVDNAGVTLINVATGQPAAVFGDDGVSTFPATVTTGGIVQDSGGKTYAFTPGGFRFPFVAPGTYRFVVTPPAGYRAPSSVATAALQALPGGPYAIVNPGSRGEAFTLNPGPAIHIDIPVDPVGSRLYLIKTAGKDAAAAGDFVPYTLHVENLDTAALVANVTISDRLPVSFRYRKGSARMNGSPLADPTVSTDGRTLTFSLGDLAAGAKTDVTYVAEVGVGITSGKATNTAVAQGAFGAVSNTAWATVRIIEDLFRSKTTIVGRVLDRCGGEERGVPGVRIFLEDGAYVVTDKNGMYHFAAVSPGTHVVQLDSITIPEQYEPVLCEENTRFAGTAFSQFVDLQGGTLWRADFHLKQLPPKEKPIGEVGLELRSALLPTRTASPSPGSQYEISYAVPMHVGTVPVRTFRLVVMLPDGVSYTPGSSRLDAATIADPFIMEGVLTYRLGDQTADWDEVLRFDASVPAAGATGDLVTKAFLLFDTPETAGEKTPTVDNTLVRQMLSEQWNVSSGMKAVATVGLATGETWTLPKVPSNLTGQQTPPAGDHETMPDYDAAWLAAAQPGTFWLWPAEGHHPNIPSTRIAIKHDPGLKPTLLLNDSPMDNIYFEGMSKKPDNTVAVSFWRGINLSVGDNRFEVVLRDASGNVVERLQRSLHYSGPATKAVLLPERSLLTADGKNPVVIAIRLLDRDGHPVQSGIRADYTVDPPYLPQKRADELQSSPLIGPDTGRVRYIIDDDGVALIELAPTTQIGEAVLHVQVAGGLQDVRTWLKPEKRDWILVGLAEGTVGYNTITGNMETFVDSSAGQDQFYEEDRLAFYAKGRIKGEWLLTVAYDSKKKNADGQQSMYQTIDPNKYYTLYGDATNQQYDAASARHIYVKLERDQFYALFGDYNTGLSVTELSRYNRNLTGFKSEMRTEHFDYNVFVADTNQAYVRDELQGDGTSGLYHLTRKNIVLNSDAVRIEVRDRFHSEVIVSTRPLSRFLDYTIDYESGTLFFKAPVFSRDENFNPVFIVAEYESFDSGDMSYNYGGRGAVRMLDNTVELGATHVHEGSVGGNGDLDGVDAKVRIDDQNILRAELATTKTDQTGIGTRGSSYLAELQHRSEKMEGKAYVREQGVDFGLGQQNGSETGTRKLGADGSYRINKSWTLGGELFQQENLATGAVRDMTELRGAYAHGQYHMQAGLRHAEDSLATGETFRSDQVFVGMKYQITERASVRFRHDQSIGSNENADFPTRTAIGTDYKLGSTATLFADQEWTKGATVRTENTRVGINAAPWTGGQIGSTLEQQSTENGVRLFSTTGLKQSWQINKQWAVDGGLDRSMTIRNTGAYTFNTSTPPASGGTEDFTAVSLGVGYRQEKWSWTARVENRHSASEDKTGVFTGANGEVKNGLALAAGLQLFQSDTAAGTQKLNSDLRLSLAYRPFETRVIILDRLDYILSEQHGGGALHDDSWRLINNLVANIKTNSRTQVSLQYAAKYIQETIEETNYRGYTDLAGIEGRYDVTNKWDIGLRGSMLHSWNLDQMNYGTSASVGCNAGKNIWISAGYNFSGYRDRDFSRAEFTSEGPFIKMRMKFDQVSVRDAVKWFSGQ